MSLLGPREKAGKSEFCLPNLISLGILIELCPNGPLHNTAATFSEPRGHTYFRSEFQDHPGQLSHSWGVRKGSPSIGVILPGKRTWGEVKTNRKIFWRQPGDFQPLKKKKKSKFRMPLPSKINFKFITNWPTLHRHWYRWDWVNHIPLMGSQKKKKRHNTILRWKTKYTLKQGNSVIA